MTPITKKRPIAHRSLFMSCEYSAKGSRNIIPSLSVVYECYISSTSMSSRGLS